MCFLGYIFNKSEIIHILFHLISFQAIFALKQFKAIIDPISSKDNRIVSFFYETKHFPLHQFLRSSCLERLYSFFTIRVFMLQRYIPQAVIPQTCSFLITTYPIYWKSAEYKILRLYACISYTRPALLPIRDFVLLPAYAVQVVRWHLELLLRERLDHLGPRVSHSHHV